MKKGIYIALSIILSYACNSDQPGLIDRFDLVNRHHVEISEVDSLNSLTVGNGEFAFTVDITGLQTFPEYHSGGIPLGTFSNWCWHSDPNEEGYIPDQTLRSMEVGNRTVGYFHDFGREGDTKRAGASTYLRQNPHRMNMGMIGLKILDENGKRISREEIRNPQQVLNLWKGEISSYFEVSGTPVSVKTLCHPEDDIIAIQISSHLLKSGRLAIEIWFPAADRGWKNSSHRGIDGHHESVIIDSDSYTTLIQHTQDSTRYMVNLRYSSGILSQSDVHRYELIPGENDTVLSFTGEFEEMPEEISTDQDFESIRKLAASDWQQFWEGGGAVDFSGCQDPRASELERRVVLSQYLTRIQCSGSLPPQETGLTFNSWFGKFHLEMHWWHGVHFPLWQRAELLKKQMPYYEKIRHQANELALKQGYRGVRWPKMVGPEGLTSPSTVGNYLIWQQPHYIYFAELLYQTSGANDSILLHYRDLVFETAEFMASYPRFDTLRDRYVLGPALIPAQETFRAETTINPSFELTYWCWAINRAIEWKKRLALPVPEKWRAVSEKLADLPISDSVYLFTEDGIDSYSNERYLSDHPMVLGCLGMLPETEKVDRATMERTFERVVENWNWPRTWGWDYPMVAMAAAELGLPEKAIHFLLLDVQKNRYLPNGHNYQDQRLPLYLPGNGGLLTTVARMCTKDQFPEDGHWDVRWENLNDF
jgi:hypothetical protein